MSTKIDKDKIYLRSYLFGVLFSFEKSILDIKNSLVDVFVNTKNIKELEEELENSEQEVLYYKELSRLYTQLKEENDNLRNMLRLEKEIQYSAHYSKVIFRDPSLVSDFLVINKGQKDGLRINMPVVYSSPNTERLVLVGKTVEVGLDYSRVKVITAKNFFVGARSQETGYTGVLRGQGSWHQNLALDYIPIEANPILGEQIVTSGGSDIYPEGLYLGEIQGIGQNVIEEFFQILYIKSEFEYSKISEVFVLDYVNNYPDFNKFKDINDGI